MQELPAGFQLDAPPAQQPRQGGFIPAPGYEEEQARRARDEGRDQTRTDIAVGSDQRTASKDQFDRITTYRNEFRTEPTVRQFREVQTATRQIIDLANNKSDRPGPGDIGLIFSFMRTLDPNSTVREGEFATAENAGGVPDTVMNAYNKLLEGGRLTPEIKQEFARTAALLHNSRLASYNAYAEDYRGLVSAEGADPDAQGIRLAEPIEFGGPEAIPSEDEPLRNFDPAAQVNPDVSAAADRLEAQLGEAGLIELAKQGITLGLSDEGGAIGTVLGRVLGGDFNVAENYGFAVEVEREVLRRARERTGGFGTAAELVGGGGAVRTLGTGALSVGRAALEGAGVGGVAGFGYGEGTAESLGGAGLGALGGAALGGGGQAILNRFGRGGGSGGGGGPTAPTTPGGEVIQAADNFNAATGANVQPLPADVGGALTRRASGAVAQTTFGAKPIVEGAQAVNEQAQAGIRTLANRQGAVPGSKQAGGEVAIKGADKVMAREKLKVDAKYAKARKEAGDARVPLPFAKTVAEQEIRTLSDTPGGTDPAGKLREIVGDLGGDYTVEGIKRFRGIIRDKLVSEGLRGSEVEAAALRIVDAADADIEDGLISLGKQGAAKAYAEASKAAAERFTLIDDVLAPVLGRKGEKSGEQVFAAIDQLARGDAVTLGKFMRALPQEEAGSLRGLVIDRLGRASKGRQDADGQAFSLSDFLTRWQPEGGLSKEAKAVLFDGETIAALDDLARVAQGTKEGQRFANFSNTGGANFLNFFLNGAPLGAVAGGVVPAAGAAAVSIGSQVGLGRLLASPSFARWLAKMPKQQNAAMLQKHVAGLEKIASANPAISADVLSLQGQLRASLPAIGGQTGAGVQSGALPLAAQTQDADSNTTGSGTQ